MIISGVAASVGFPPFLAALSTLRTKPVETTSKQPAAVGQSSSSRTGATNSQANLYGVNNRAQSMYVQSTSSAMSHLATSTPTGVTLSSSRGGAAPLQPQQQLIPTVVAPASKTSIAPAAESSATAYNSNRYSKNKGEEETEEDWDAEFAHDGGCSSFRPLALGCGGSNSNISTQDQSKPRQPRVPFPAARKPAASTKRLPHQRRVQSAPSTALKRFGDGLDGDVFDALFEDDDNDNIDGVGDQWVVASVKAKVEKRKEKELERSVSANAGLESWDDDFDDGTDGVDNSRIESGRRPVTKQLVIPASVIGVQQSVKIDAINVRRFAWHVEGLLRISFFIS
jgi:hypothetical protein